MYRTYFAFLKCTTQGGPNVDALLIAFLHLWLKFWEGIDKYWNRFDKKIILLSPLLTITIYIVGSLRMVGPPRPGGTGLPCHGTE